MTALHTLNLANNAFYGPLPPEFGASSAAFPGLLTLCVALSGRPWLPCLVACMRMSASYLACLPPQLTFYVLENGVSQALVQLLRLLRACCRGRRQLQGNDLNGTLPQFGPGSWVSLSALNLTGNDFEGSALPREWGRSSMAYVKYVDLANCSLVRLDIHLRGSVACAEVLCKALNECTCEHL